MVNIVAILGLLLAVPSGSAAMERGAATLCDRDKLADGATIIARGTLWSDSHHGAYLRDNACPDIAVRLGIHPEDSEPSVAALLADLASSAWPQGVTYNLHVQGRIIHTPKGLRVVLSNVISYEKLRP
ncbi:hypothetical protein [Luteimonas sp. MC1828]|uniref:hypothetical protein n=1 Tax=Luteimonas sp. MC1828 TaxID=2799787 RepID=UPI0018F26C1D|nr:hypothetical protein [Luteimonas sp. MC1828]MBJ7576256.1 hypothetical protein [Luteimonas sp. MC1828]